MRSSRIFQTEVWSVLKRSVQVQLVLEASDVDNTHGRRRVHLTPIPNSWREKRARHTADSLIQGVLGLLILGLRSNTPTLRPVLIHISFKKLKHSCEDFQPYHNVNKCNCSTKLEPETPYYKPSFYRWAAYSTDLETLPQFYSEWELKSSEKNRVSSTACKEAGTHQSLSEILTLLYLNIPSTKLSKIGHSTERELAGKGRRVWREDCKGHPQGALANQKPAA